MNKEINLKVDNLTIRGKLYYPGDKAPPYPTVILCHGIPSGIVDPSDGGYPLLAKTIRDEGFAVITFSFRGTGISEGNFDIVGWTHDLKAMIDYAWSLPEVDERCLFLTGFSAGAAVSVYVAAEDKRVSGINANACPSDFSFITDNGQPQKSVAYFRKTGIIRDAGYPTSMEDWQNGFRKVNALHSVADIAPRPLLLIHANQDNVVPVFHSQKLYERAGEPKQIIIIEGSEHRLRRNEMAVDTILGWLKSQVLKIKKGG
jgi:fermentation-respiration switch protein FrsA (DUF1100 family)